MAADFVEISTQLNKLKRKVDFNTYDISVKEIISWVDEDIINIAPDYQRQFRWGPERQSALIESIFLGIPVPSLYMATNADGTWELVDGVQRLSSLIHFAGTLSARSKLKFKSELEIRGLEKLTTFNGVKLNSLPKSIQLDFLLKPIKITTLSDKSDTDVRFDLFERLNKGGIALTNQEIRSCVFRGKFNEFIQRLSKEADFTSVTRMNDAQRKDGTQEEYVLRFFAYLNNYNNFDHSVVEFLNHYMRDASKKFDYKSGEKIFKETFKQLSLLPNGITRGRTTTPTNLFEGVAVGAALAIKQLKKLDVSTVGSWIGSKELTSFSTGATNSRSKVTKRIEFCRDKFMGR